MNDEILKTDALASAVTSIVLIDGLELYLHENRYQYQGKIKDHTYRYYRARIISWRFSVNIFRSAMPLPVSYTHLTLPTIYSV